MEPTAVTYTQLRWPDIVEHRTVLRRLGEDDHGVWLGSTDGGGVRLIPASSWWTATWHATHDGMDGLVVQTSRPASWTTPDDVVVTLLDLEIVRSNGDVSVANENRFAQRRDALEYPEAVVDRARTTTAAMYLAVAAGHEPFGEIGRSWLRISAGDALR